MGASPVDETGVYFAAIALVGVLVAMVGLSLMKPWIWRVYGVGVLFFVVWLALAATG